MSNKPNQTLTIHYQNDVPLNLDDVVYIVENASNGSATFYQKCRVCGGTHSLTVNDVTFACPCCRNEEAAITVHKYVVRRYRVFKVEVEKGIDTWKPSSYQTVRFYAHQKTDRGHWCTYTRQLSYDEINPAEPLHRSNPAFTDYALAVAAANDYNERERARLADYNELHGTQYEIPAEFADIENDKKSN